jgi:hypothetical protein
VQAWRRAHPGYWRRSPPKGASGGVALQDSLITQAIDNKQESGQFMAPALQDLLTAQPTVLLGLIAQFTDSTLQDDISRMGQRLLRLGQDVLQGQAPGDGQSPASKATHLPRQSQAPPAEVQLD